MLNDVICNVESDADSERECQEEGRKAVIRRVESMPAQEELGADNVSHIHFRSCCIHGVQG